MKINTVSGFEKGRNPSCCRYANRLKERCLRFGGHRGFLLHLSLLGSLLAKDSDGEFFVVKAATAVLVVAVEEGAQLLGGEVHAAFFEHALELVEVHTARVHHVEVLEHLHEAGLFRHLGIRLLDQLVLKLLLKSDTYTQR